MALSMLDIVNAQAALAEKDKITLEEFSEAMRSGDRSTIEEAVAQMQEAGGYDNLE